MNHLLRSLAPISDAGWDALDTEARERLAPALAGRRLIDFAGPHGWQHSATNLGRVELAPSLPSPGVTGLQRRVLPLLELRADFAISRSELADIDRGAIDIDLAPLDEAAHQIAVAENAAIFHGWKGAIIGISAASSHRPRALGKRPDHYPGSVTGAVELLLENGIAGPFALALGPDVHRVVLEAAETGGALLRDHLAEIVGGPIIWAPGVTGAVLLSTRGGDFLLDAGQDLSIGYQTHDEETVRLYLQESFSFRVATAEAAVALTP